MAGKKLSAISKIEIMNITVLTPNRAIFQGTIESVKVPGVSGEFQVLKNHAPIVSALEAGKVTIVTAAGTYQYFDQQDNEMKSEESAGKRLVYQVNGGFIEVLNNEVSLLITSMSAL
jgi:F-type H+-transporting ATPase subunit epsilon